MKLSIRENDLSHHLEIDLPYTVGLKASCKDFEGLPRSLPFVLGLNPTQDLLTRPYDAHVEAEINRGYGSATHYTMLFDQEFSVRRGEAMVEALTAVIGEDWTGKRALEIGCGNGALLKRVRAMGAEVHGCEPGPRAKEARDAGINVVNAFFDTKYYPNVSFDVIYHHCLLEHIPDACALLEKNFDLLNPGGVLVTAVPDCTQELEIGDLRILTHQHWNYFKPDSAMRLLEHIGFERTGWQRSPYDGTMFVWGFKGSADGSEGVMPPSPSGAENDLKRFASRLKANLHALNALAQQAHAEGKRIGIYGVDANLFHLIDWRQPPRTFDGDSTKHGKFFVADEHAIIEPPTRLLDDPVDQIWIAPIHHDAAIRKYLEHELELATKVEIVSLKDLYCRLGGMN